jgi:transcriptional regulator with XRE-family HTH domain
MNTKKWFNDKIKEFRGTIDYETEKVILALTEKIVEFMENNNDSRVELAKRLGVSKAFVTKILNGNPNLTIKSMVSIAIALECELDIDICPEGVKVWKVYTPPTVRGFDATEYTEEFKPKLGGDTDAVAA